MCWLHCVTLLCLCFGGLAHPTLGTWRGESGRKSGLRGTDGWRELERPRDWEQLEEKEIATRRSLQLQELSQYEEVIPYFILDQQRVSLDAAFQGGYPPRLQCVLEAEGSDLLLNLEQNDKLLSGSPRLLYYLPNGTRVTEAAEALTNCYYQGSVKGFPHSRVSIGLCFGLSGLIVLNANQSYGVEPLEGEQNGRHLIYRTKDVRLSDAKCGVSHGSHEHTVPDLTVEEPRRNRLKRDVLSETKYIELALVADEAEFQSYRSLKRLKTRMLEIANQVDAFYRRLNVRVMLVGLEVWSSGDQIKVDRNPTDTLNRFLRWRKDHLLPRMHHDNAQLLIGAPFDGSAIGMASQTSMCSRDRSGGVNVDHSVSILGIASTLAHELGHNMGMSHDTADRKCHCPKPTRQSGCIMEPSTGFLPGQVFSSCSRQDLETSLRQGGGMCLFNVPERESLAGVPRCGNLFVENGEECDCGLAIDCKDPCCNATTCKLVPGAECSSVGICCENCKLKPAGSTCREPLGECDLPEHCTGASPYCPPNVFIQNGQICSRGRAYCHSGVCLTYQLQCQILWGPGSSQAPDVCFNTVNTKGDKYGNCGQQPNGAFISCAEQDVKCGKIQCEGGNDRPVLGSNAEIVVSPVMVKGKQYSCRGTYFNLGDDVTDPAMVMQGTVCGDGKACINRTCQDVSVFGVYECQKKCNGHGVCNSNSNCHCDQGWAPPDCRSSGYGGSVDSGPLQQAREKPTLTVSLLVIFLLVLPLAAVLVLCFFKRNLIRRELGRLGKDKSQQYKHSSSENGAQDESDRRGYRPPDWMHPTELQMTQPSKAPSRPDPPSKPLPPDPLLRSSKASVPVRPAPPSKPLPADPIVKHVQPRVPAKPPPPSKPLPSDPLVQPLTEEPTQHSSDGLAVPKYVPQVAMAPSRAPPPPPSKKSVCLPAQTEVA
ncbi:disintegrin and metalloproteinase domain-containing protein 15 isoform X2 [Latimeria chalumnae]|uniref:disintegrin and metalloproteinase domain-containing protein 15 isoform X2 n=1 Tax=Latimeria chalumnae TaxID=7897 RepID=UPI0006D8FF02|nr:PREDICTED: disintegrin and metalloproteinase domain-containing protein 15 isoform X2 [Latimeria chalumnae]|eukprot:XP_014347564.1 PREDICTED: disintegrin and metalloproteinase domain-containing protein 15 isoform X2 [Latimeria chalumnae]